MCERGNVHPTRDRTRKMAGSTYSLWSPEDDDRLLKMVKDRTNINWRAIARCFPGRTPKQVATRWCKVRNPSIVKGSWRPEEDQVIQDWVKEQGPTHWCELARQLPGRLSKQCRERWLNVLDPSVNHTKWTEEEDMILIRNQQLLGNKWADISKLLPGRTDNCVKNRWYSTLQRRLKQSAESGDRLHFLRKCYMSMERQRQISGILFGNEGAQSGEVTQLQRLNGATRAGSEHVALNSVSDADCNLVQVGVKGDGVNSFAPDSVPKIIDEKAKHNMNREMDRLNLHQRECKEMVKSNDQMGVNGELAPPNDNINTDSMFASGNIAQNTNGSFIQSTGIPQTDDGLFIPDNNISQTNNALSLYPTVSESESLFAPVHFDLISSIQDTQNESNEQLPSYVNLDDDSNENHDMFFNVKYF